ncbi:histone H1-like [Anguilla rostrata]|uniref:histone H1-like n=1 Tax=Anguilla rostrata TaxID=7938 RepID=UPI0030CB027F
MGESPAASPTRSPKKSPKKRRAAKPKKTGPSVRDLIVKAVTASKQRNGVSLAALKKALKAGGYNVEKNKGRIRVAVKGLVTKGTLVHTKGTGASGSFKLNKKPHKPTKKAGSKARKSPAKKKPKAKRAKKARKSPKKAKRPAAKKAKSPRKAKKRTAAKKAKSPRKARPAKRRVSKGKRAAAKKK